MTKLSSRGGSSSLKWEKWHNVETSLFFRHSDFWDSRIAKSAVSTQLEALNFDFYDFFHFLKAKMFQYKIYRARKNAKYSIFGKS